MENGRFAIFSENIEKIKNNSEYCYNSDICSEVWTLGKLKDELFVYLISIKINGERKYEKQARDLIYRISIYHPTPYFIIHNSDLSSRLKKELSILDDADLDIVIKDVVSWIYESINKNYFWLSIKRHGLLFWRIES